MICSSDTDVLNFLKRSETPKTYIQIGIDTFNKFTNENFKVIGHLLIKIFYLYAASFFASAHSSWNMLTKKFFKPYETGAFKNLFSYWVAILFTWSILLQVRCVTWKSEKTESIGIRIIRSNRWQVRDAITSRVARDSRASMTLIRMSNCSSHPK